MAGAATPGHEVVLETDRLLLRPWRASEVVFQRELWTERDPRVPPHRRHDADGPPRLRTSRIGSAMQSPRRSGCWRSSGRPTAAAGPSFVWVVLRSAPLRRGVDYG